MAGPRVVHRRLLPRFFGLAAVGVAFVALAGCTCDDMLGKSKRIEEAAISKCERGIEQAKTAPTADQAMAIYYRECAFLNAEAGCRKAYLRAADAPEPERLPAIVEACSKAYCPLLKERPFEACAPGFKPTGEAVFRAWPPLSNAILAYDVGDAQGRLAKAMLGLYLYVQQKSAPVPSASAPASAGAAGDAGPAASASAMPVPSGSAKVAAAASSGAPAPAISAVKGQPAPTKPAR